MFQHRKKCHTLIMKQVHQNTNSGYLWVIYSRDEYFPVFSRLSILNKLFLGLESGGRVRKNKSWTVFLFFPVNISFTKKINFNLYSFFLEVKQLDLAIYNNRSNENKLVNPIYFKNASSGVRQIWIWNLHIYV